MFAGLRGRPEPGRARRGAVANQSKRAQMYAQAETLAQQQAFYIPFCRVNNGYATTTMVNGFIDNYRSLNSGVKASSLVVTK